MRQVLNHLDIKTTENLCSQNGPDKWFPANSIFVKMFFQRKYICIVVKNLDFHFCTG